MRSDLQLCGAPPKPLIAVNHVHCKTRHTSILLATYPLLCLLLCCCCPWRCTPSWSQPGAAAVFAQHDRCSLCHVPTPCFTRLCVCCSAAAAALPPLAISCSQARHCCCVCLGASLPLRCTLRCLTSLVPTHMYCLQSLMCTARQRQSYPLTSCHSAAAAAAVATSAACSPARRCCCVCLAASLPQCWTSCCGA
jgi:hypothetical protein